MTTLQPERPAGNLDDAAWGSDRIAQMLRHLGVRYVALNPGSSFRGLHDSLVNHLGNVDPQMLLCLHEEHAVALAHGWAKVTGEPMAVVLHANVGLMHATMAIYNAWCDRVPMLVFGATGPVDAAKRRPWIDWIHTSRDQAALVRPYVKWDDQPASLAASLESMLRANQVTRTAPSGPVYVCFDVSVQEAPLDPDVTIPDVSRYRAPGVPPPDSADVSSLAGMLKGARSPVFLIGRVSRDPIDWSRRIALAEMFRARVVTDIKTGAAFPTGHDLHAGSPSYFLTEQGKAAIMEADLIVAFDWVDLAGTLSQAGGGAKARIVQVTMEGHLQNGWSLDHQGLAPADLTIVSTADRVVQELTEVLSLPIPEAAPAEPVRASAARVGDDAMDIRGLAAAMRQGLVGESVSLVRLPLGWDSATWGFCHPLDYLGYDGGAGIGSGPGMSIGAALALQGHDRLPVAVLGDGDYMMGVSALWTAARYGIPLLVIVANNQSFFNDEIHQERVAQTRQRPVGNRWIGQRIAGPEIDLAAMAKAQGLSAYGPVRSGRELAGLLPLAVAEVKRGRPVVIDAHVSPGYAPVMAGGMTNSPATETEAG